MKNGWMSFSGQLQKEMQSVYNNLLEMANELESPLRELVHAQISSAQPYLRAGLVLSAGYGESDSEELQNARVCLATALEMLYVALSIHGLLMPYDGDAFAEDPNKTLLGSTVLAGDYCFSQSAIMAARTADPEVVAIFAKALQDVSEGQLRQIFALESASIQTNLILFVAGVTAAATLRRASTQEEEQLIGLSRQFASRLDTQKELADLENAVNQSALATPLKARWLEVVQLL